MTFLPRKILLRLQAHLAKKQVTVLTGLRQTGKTTLIKKLLEEVPSKNKLYLDLQRPDIRELFARKNYDTIPVELTRQGLNPQEKMTLALDEIQLAPEIVSAIKYLYDHYQIKFIVTGSSSYYLKDLFTESLAGRKTIFELYPLDFGEFLDFKGVAHRAPDWRSLDQFSVSEYERLRLWYEEYVAWGGFPEVALVSAPADKEEILRDLMSSYIN